jgi:hypothetical protein
VSDDPVHGETSFARKSRAVLILSCTCPLRCHAPDCSESGARREVGQVADLPSRALRGVAQPRSIAAPHPSKKPAFTRLARRPPHQVSDAGLDDADPDAAQVSVDPAPRGIWAPTFEYSNHGPPDGTHLLERVAKDLAAYGIPARAATGAHPLLPTRRSAETASHNSSSARFYVPGGQIAKEIGRVRTRNQRRPGHDARVLMEWGEQRDRTPLVA